MLPATPTRPRGGNPRSTRGEEGVGSPSPTRLEDLRTLLYGMFAQGEPMGENDLWIAAAALDHGLTPVTRDGHFERVVMALGGRL